jgi:adenylate cyclase
MMDELREKTFDPTVLDAFFAIETEILHIAERFRDEADGTDKPDEES